MPPPKADQYQSEANARAILRWYQTERWKRRGRTLAWLLLYTAAVGALIYHWGIEAQRLAGCWP